MMKRSNPSLFFVLIMMSCFACSKANEQKPRNGDLIFHTSKSQQSGFIQTITGSPLSHVGVIYVKDDRTLVLEAVNPVKITPLENWINRGSDRNYVLMRPHTALTDKELKHMLVYGMKNLGKPYDIRFQWSDKHMYCSELVYKIYLAAGIELCPIRRFKDFNLSSEAAIREISRRYEIESLNTDEIVVSPADLRNSSKLKVITDTY